MKKSVCVWAATALCCISLLLSPAHAAGSGEFAALISAVNGSAELELNNEQPGSCVVAIFDQDGRFLTMESRNVPAHAGRIRMAYPQIPGRPAGSAKAFLLGDGLKPLAPAAEGSFDGTTLAEMPAVPPVVQNVAYLVAATGEGGFGRVQIIYPDGTVNIYETTNRVVNSRGEWFVEAESNGSLLSKSPVAVRMEENGTVTLDCLDYLSVRGKLRGYDAASKIIDGYRVTPNTVFSYEILEEKNGHLKTVFYTLRGHDDGITLIGDAEIQVLSNADNVARMVHIRVEKSKIKDNMAPKLSDMDLEVQPRGTYQIRVRASDLSPLQSMELRSSVPGIIPAMNLEAKDQTVGEMEVRYGEGCWEIDLGTTASKKLASYSGTSIQLYLSLTDTDGHRFGNLENPGDENTRTVTVPEIILYPYNVVMIQDLVDEGTEYPKIKAMVKMPNFTTGEVTIGIYELNNWGDQDGRDIILSTDTGNLKQGDLAFFQLSAEGKMKLGRPEHMTEHIPLQKYSPAEGKIGDYRVNKETSFLYFLTAAGGKSEYRIYSETAAPGIPEGSGAEMQAITDGCGTAKFVFLRVEKNKIQS